MSISFTPQKELAPEIKVNINQVRYPQYGRYLEEYIPGQIFVHPRGFTFGRDQADAFARTFMQANPLYLNEEYAKVQGFRTTPISPQMVFNVVLSLGVQNDSEKVIANLGYYDAQFLAPVYPGDTIQTMTEVVDRQEKGEEKPGIVTIKTVGTNQNQQVVLQYERKLMVAFRGDRSETIPLSKEKPPVFPWVESAQVELPQFSASPSNQLTGWNTYFEDFNSGDIIVHASGRTISNEHFALTYQTGNTHPLHFDQIFSQNLSGKMSGEPIVYGGLVFAWLEGLASRDISENALWELGFTEGYHTQPAIAGDTIAAISRVLSVAEAPTEVKDIAGIVTFQLIGVKNISAANALKKYGEVLFTKENAKRNLGKEKIAEKIFEIERRLLIKKGK